MRFVAVVVGLALTACSGSSHQAQPPATTTSASTQPTAPPTTQPATTEARIYSPWTDAVRRQTAEQGECFSGSAFVMRSDAWRCTVGNLIYDPCFSDPTGPATLVACPDSPESPKVTVIRVKDLPLAYANKGGGTSGDPWALKLADGKQCRFAGGATITIADQRLNYTCGEDLNLFGDPERHDDRRWKIYAGAQGATQLTQVDIAIAWF